MLSWITLLVFAGALFEAPKVLSVPTDCCTKEENTNYPSNDLQHKQTTNADSCANECADTAECKFWTFQEEGTWCYLKTSDSFQHSSLTGFTSGNKACGQGKPVCNSGVSATTTTTTTITTSTAAAATTTTTTTTTTVAPESNCECSETTKTDHLDRIIGRCLRKVKSKFWCYVPQDAECSDKRESKREKGLFWSFKACQTYKDSPANTG